MIDYAAGSCFVYDADADVLRESASLGAADVVDSFVVDDGVGRGVDRHLRRFAASCVTWRGVDEAAVHSFVTRALAAIPPAGSWFPRLELLDHQQAQFALRLRPRPPLSSAATLWRPDEPVMRRAPRIKGPDLPSMDALRLRARQAGADEALVVAADGYLLESSHSNVVWWRDDVLCTVPADAAALPGITRGLLLDLAVADGYQVREEWITPAALEGLEVWALNALHGLRPVVGFVGIAAFRPSVAVRAPAWRARLDSTGSTGWQRR